MRKARAEVMTPERPIFFTPESVRQILAGRQTETRRVVKRVVKRGSFGSVGDRLWVQEEWRIGSWDEEDATILVDYRSAGHPNSEEWRSIPDDDDGEKFNALWIGTCDELEAKGIESREDGYHWNPGESPCRWRRAIVMPRWASRLTLEITGVTCERVQDITQLGALHEGCDGPDHRAQYAMLWDLTAKHGDEWDMNPWVWAIAFRVVR